MSFKGVKEKKQGEVSLKSKELNETRTFQIEHAERLLRYDSGWKLDDKDYNFDENELVRVKDESAREKE